MCTMSEDVRPTRGVPDVHRFIVAARRYTRTVWRPRCRRNGQTMPTIGEEMAPGGCFPDLHGAVVARRGDTFAIRRPAHRLYSIPVSTINNHAEAVRGIPESHGLIIAGGGDVRALWRPCHRRHAAGMSIADVARIALRLRLRLVGALEPGQRRRLWWLVGWRQACWQGIGFADQSLRGDLLEFLPHGCNAGGALIA